MKELGLSAMVAVQKLRFFREPLKVHGKIK